MKLSKNQQEGIKRVYESYWESYLSGDIDGMGLLLSDDFNVIGSTAGEVFRNKKEVLKYYSDTADQIKNKLEFRNRGIELVNYDQFVLVNEHSDAYVLIEDDWTFYSKVRLSSLLRETDNGWKFVQQQDQFQTQKHKMANKLHSKKLAKKILNLERL